MKRQPGAVCAGGGRPVMADGASDFLGLAEEGRSDPEILKQSASSSPRELLLAAQSGCAQIIPFGRGTGGQAGDQIAAHIGGSARGYLVDLSRISVSAVMGVHGRIASVACIFIQSIPSYECAHMPHSARLVGW
jgi:hypothetical protein